MTIHDELTGMQETREFTAEQHKAAMSSWNSRRSQHAALMKDLDRKLEQAAFEAESKQNQLDTADKIKAMNAQTAQDEAIAQYEKQKATDSLLTGEEIRVKEGRERITMLALAVDTISDITGIDYLDITCLLRSDDTIDAAEERRIDEEIRRLRVNGKGSKVT